MKKIKAFGIALYKIKNNKKYILLCKSINSTSKYGFLKGVQCNNESNKETAIREFREESGINIDTIRLEDFFYQKNELKDIGIYLVNFDKINEIENYFILNSLKEKFICSENSEVKFFDIEDLPPIKKKQIKLTHEIKIRLLTYL